MKLVTKYYLAQKEHWPKSGRHILAQFDDEYIVVYQAFRPSIGHFAAQNNYFGGPDYQLTRMSWIKTNFLWMMYRCGWGTKPGQEVILAIWLKRTAFDELLARCIHSSYLPQIYSSQENWKQAVGNSSVRLQWDPDHNPAGGKEERRAIQLGMRWETLKQFAEGGWIAQIEDISEFVASQRENAHRPYLKLLTPYEQIYPVDDTEVSQKLQIIHER